MKWFGETWHAPVCEPDQQVGTPYGLPCKRCGVALERDDRGFMLPHGFAWSPFHRDCLWAELGIAEILDGFEAYQDTDGAWLRKRET